MPIGSLLDFNQEILRKKAYNPSAEDLEYIEAQYREFAFDQQEFQKQRRAFNDRNFLDYMTLAEDDLFRYVPPPADPFDWRNFIRSGDERNKNETWQSFLQSMNFKLEGEAKDWMGNISQSMGEVGEAFVQYMNIIDQTDVKDAWSDLALSVHGVLFKQVKFDTRSRINKIAEEWNPKANPDGYSYESVVKDDKVGVFSKVLKPNRVFVSDFGQPLMEEQDHVWYEVVIPYAKAYQIAGEWEAWQYVKPYNPSYDQWTDTDTDTELESKTLSDKVRIRVRESKVTCELTIYFNKVKMTPRGLKLPDDEYSIIVQQNRSLYPTGMIYGLSFMDNVRPYVAVKDVLTSVMVDTARQVPEPPLKSRFRTMVNRYMFKPGSVTPFQGEGDLTPLIPPGAMQNFVFEALKVYEGMIDKSSTSPIFSGQAPVKGQMTKYEVEKMLEQSIRSVANMMASHVNWRKQEASLKLKLGLKHFQEITGSKFQIDGADGSSSRVIEFKKIPTRQKQYLAALKKMSQAENLGRASGKKVKNYMVDPDKTGDYSFNFNFRVIPQEMPSKAANQEALAEKVSQYRQSQNIDQKAVDRMLIRGMGDDEEELLQKQAPPAPPQPGQPGQPGQPTPGSTPPAPPQAPQPPQPAQAPNPPQMQPA